MEKNKTATIAVCDAGPLIHLDELDSLDLLADFWVWVPDRCLERGPASSPHCPSATKGSLRAPSRFRTNRTDPVGSEPCPGTGRRRDRGLGYHGERVPSPIPDRRRRCTVSSRAAWIPSAWQHRHLVAGYTPWPAYGYGSSGLPTSYSTTFLVAYQSCFTTRDHQPRATRIRPHVTAHPYHWSCASISSPSPLPSSPLHPLLSILPLPSSISSARLRTGFQPHHPPRPRRLIHCINHVHCLPAVVTIS